MKRLGMRLRGVCDKVAAVAAVGLAMVGLSCLAEDNSVTNFASAVNKAQGDITQGMTVLILAVAAIVALGLAIWGIIFAYQKLRGSAAKSA